jgi:hypothetical protein
MTSEGSTIPVETFSVADGGKIGKVLSSDSSREETEASLEGRMPSQSDASDSIITEASPFAGTGFETPGAVLLAPPYDRIASPELKPVDSVAAESKGESSGANAKDELSTSSRSPTLSEAAARDERANDSDLDDPDIPVNIEAAAVEEKVVTDLVNHPAIQKTAEKLHPLLISFDGVHNFRDLSSYPSTVDGKQVRLFLTML